MRLRYDPRALADIQAIHDYIAKDDTAAARRVIERVERTIHGLETLRWSGRPGNTTGTRLVAVPGLPYIVVHRVHDGMVDVIAILHTARGHRS